MSIDADRLPSWPLRNWFLAWHIHTGDPPEVIAKGFDVDEEIVVDLLSGEASLMMETSAALAICCNLRVDPQELWPRVDPRDGASFLEVDPPWSDIPGLLVEALGSRPVSGG